MVSFSEVKQRLDSLLGGELKEKLITEAKKKVIDAYQCLSSGETTSDHVNKLRQHEQQLCELLRHTGRILVRLRAKGDRL